MSHIPPFHLAIPVDDLAKADEFYAGVLGCPRGRFSEEWTDYNFFGHQLVAHLSPQSCTRGVTNSVDGHAVPVRHFGCVLPKDQWGNVALQINRAGITFLIEPNIRFEGEIGEQGTFFVHDPAFNALEFKYFADADQLFASAKKQ